MRQPRFDWPGMFHHVMWHAPSGEQLFHDDIDRQRFLQEIALVAPEENVRVFARSEMSTHCHLGLQSGENGISAFMQRLGRRYSGAFNLRHTRRGPVVWGRFTSKLVDSENYLVRLVRYIHRNPVKAGIITIDQLDQYPWTGHSALMGQVMASYMSLEMTLGIFGSDIGMARAKLRAYMSDSTDDNEAAFDHIEIDENDPRSAILGDDNFAEDALRRADARNVRKFALKRRGIDLDSLAVTIGARFGVTPDKILSDERHRLASAARSIVVFLAVHELGLRRVDIAARLGVSPAAVTQLVQRGRLRAASLGIDEIEAAIGSDVPSSAKG